MSLTAIGYDRAPNTSTGLIVEKRAVVGKGFVTIEQNEKKLESLFETKDQYNRPIIRMVFADGYEITIPDKNIYKEYKFE